MRHGTFQPAQMGVIAGVLTVGHFHSQFRKLHPMLKLLFTGAIVGGRSAEQVDGWIGASRFELTNEEMKEIAAAITATGAGTGPALPPTG